MITGNFLTCETKKGLMDIYVSSQQTRIRLPIVLVFQEAFGVNSHIRSICDRLAEEGFLAAAPDLFHRMGRRIEIPYSERKSIMPLLAKMRNQEIVEDARETLNFLDVLPTADTNNYSTLGFCVGGFSSALCATQMNVKKMVSFYGAGMVRPREGVGLTPFIDEMKKIKAPCLFFFGGMDASIPRTDIIEIEKKLSASKVSFEADIFENSDHGFFCDERKSYNQEDASIAWKKTLQFLRQQAGLNLSLRTLCILFCWFRAHILIWK
ncbi:MAG: dienelactone hydrolase family protein [Bacteriovoracia bacterium]